MNTPLQTTSATLTRFATASLVAAIFMLPSGPAHSLFGGGCKCAWNAATNGHVTRENEKVRRQVRESIEQQTVDLNDHLTLTMQQHAAENSAHQRMQANAQQRIEDAAQVNAVQRMRDDFRARAESGVFDPARDSCLLLDMYGTGGGASPSTTGSDIVNDVAQVLDGNDADVAKGGVTWTRKQIDEWERYGDWTLRGQTRRNATTDWGVVAEHPTIEFDDPDTKTVIDRIVLNTIDNTPEPPLSAAERLTPEGLDEQVRRNEIRARQRAAEESIKMILNMRTGLPSANTAAFRAMADDSAYDQAERPIGDSLSELQQLDILTVWNYAPRGDRAETLSNPGGMTERAWLFEIHRVLTVIARLQYLSLELQSRDALVAAAQLATMNDP